MSGLLVKPKALRVKESDLQIPSVKTNRSYPTKAEKNFGENSKVLECFETF